LHRIKANDNPFGNTAGPVVTQNHKRPAKIFPFLGDNVDLFPASLTPVLFSSEKYFMLLVEFFSLLW
jgi:hypothetical protein